MKGIFVCIAMLSVFSVAYADVPNFINFRGYLSEYKDGSIQDVDLQFKIYNHVTESGQENLIWSATRAVTLYDGNFAIMLGSGGGEELSASVFSSDARYITVSLPGMERELFDKRQRIVSTPYAMVADSLSSIRQIWYHNPLGDKRLGPETNPPDEPAGHISKYLDGMIYIPKECKRVDSIYLIVYRYQARPEDLQNIVFTGQYTIIDGNVPFDPVLDSEPGGLGQVWELAQPLERDNSVFNIPERRLTKIDLLNWLDLGDGTDLADKYIYMQIGFDEEFMENVDRLKVIVYGAKINYYTY